jgi:lysophospholipase L1-like esterase
VVISLGANDGGDPVALRAVRGAITAARVVWLLPRGHESAWLAVRRVATEYGDQVIDTTAAAGRDGVHPTPAGARSLAAQVDL